MTKYTVELAAAAGDLPRALELAETNKNNSLRWIWGIEAAPEIRADQLRQLLTPGTALIYWHLSPSALSTFLLRPDSSELVLLPPPPSDDPAAARLHQVQALEQWLQDWQQDYRRRAKTTTDRDPWRLEMENRLAALRDLLHLEALRPQLAGCTHLLLSPHRDLHRLPLHALLPEWPCTYLPSANLALPQPPPTLPLPSLLLVEKPDSRLGPHEAKQFKGLAELPFAEAEAALLRQLLPNADTLSQPTRDSILARCQTPRAALHFCGHAAYDAAQPLQSCLFLQGTERLAARDLLDCDLSAYSLVSLAACETGIAGEVALTADYVGLVSAFLRAGAAAVLSTLWTVESFATTLLILEFYRRLQTGQPAAAALHAAQTWLRTATAADLHTWTTAARDDLGLPKGRSLDSCARRFASEPPDSRPYEHPYFWAAFTLAGHTFMPQDS